MSVMNFMGLMTFSACGTPQPIEITLTAPDPNQVEVQHKSSPTPSLSPETTPFPSDRRGPEPSPSNSNTSGNSDTSGTTASSSTPLPAASSSPSSDSASSPSTSASGSPSTSPSPLNPRDYTNFWGDETSPSDESPNPSGPNQAPNPAPISPVGMAEVQNVILVALESNNIQGTLDQPFLKSLAARGAILTHYSAVAHPRQPNYIAMVSGDTYGVDSEKPVNVDAPHLGDLMEKKKLNWKVFAENYPGNCFLDDFYSPSSHGQPSYARMQVPFLNFKSIQEDSNRCTRMILNSHEFDSTCASHKLPEFSLYVPPYRSENIHINDESQNIFIDGWLSSRFQKFLDNADNQKSVLFVVVFGEGTQDQTNQSSAIFFGSGVQPGVQSQQHYDHYSLLYTLEKIFKLDSLGGKDLTAKMIDDIWKH